MTRHEQQGDPKNLTVSELLDIIRSKVTTQIEHAGFILNMQNNSEIQHATILVDNAIKFSSQAEKKSSTLVANN
jgi:hypothetical protein